MRIGTILAIAWMALSANVASAQMRAKTLDQFCPKSLEVGKDSGTIYKNSAPVRANSSLTAPIVYFRREPTLIFGRRNFTGSSFTIYDGKGTSLGRCPYATAHGAQGRARCTMQTTSVRRAAVKNTGSPTVYFKVSSNTCVKIPDAGACYGSVKGLCNQVLK